MHRIIQTLSFAALLGTSVVANAVIIEVKYEGVVDSVAIENIGNALSTGYAEGDLISGSIFINTDVAPGEYCVTDPGYCDPNKVADYANGFGLGDDSNFVTGNVPADIYSEDWVYLVDDDGGLDDFQVGEDEYSWYDDDAGNFGGTDYEFYVGLLAAVGVDFINGLGLEQAFELTDTDAILEGFLYKESYEYVADPDGIYVDDFGVASTLVSYYEESFYITLNSLSASVVPEPGTIALFSLGLVGFAATRRKKA